MNYRVHTLGAIASACGLIYIANKVGINVKPNIFIGGAVIGGLLPDIDCPTSMLGSSIKPLSEIIKATVGHRTLFHSVLFVFIVGALISIYNVTLGIGLALGIVSHIILDLLTPRTYGVAFLYPFYTKRIKLCKPSRIN